MPAIVVITISRQLGSGAGGAVADRVKSGEASQLVGLPSSCAGGRGRSASGASCLTLGVVQKKTISSNASLVLAMETMVNQDIGRFPVLERGSLIGIVTRSDVTRALSPRKTLMGSHGKEK